MGRPVLGRPCFLFNPRSQLYRPHICPLLASHLPLLASPPTPLQGERGVICKATTKLNNTICKAPTRGNSKGCKAITRTNKHNSHAPTRGIIKDVRQLQEQTSITAMLQQGISLPSPLGEGLGVRPVWSCSEAGWAGGEAFY